MNKIFADDETGPFSTFYNSVESEPKLRNNMKKIAFFTEMGFTGKIPRNHRNMKTMEAWICALEADHIPLLSGFNKQYDLGIITIPKNWFKLGDDLLVDYIEKVIKKYCKKIAIMQEGPNYYFQDFDVNKQIWYLQILEMADFLLCHNEYDIQYFEGLTGKDVYVLSSLMITDLFKDDVYTRQDAVMIGGNFCSWYGGFDSWMVAREMQIPMYAPSMGRKQKDEEQIINEIKYLPYYDWYRWNIELRKMRYGIHLMRTYAAGTFALNCAYWGIPCIGYKNLDTQRYLHTNFSVNEGDINEARRLARMLKDDKEFYNEYSLKCKQNYNQYYKEDVFIKRFNEILQEQSI
ncbi:MAG: hypothetical protein JETCAE03_32600 [Ignavibacteriaceae bacterium]|jgi:hypothetical protein|nr:MAG: hypothetical protein JETCAE03_32600 [Ignavibacteriaceae bacterium]